MFQYPPVHLQNKGTTGSRERTVVIQTYAFFFAVPRIISAVIGFLGKHTALTNVNVQHYPASCPNKVFKQTTGWILCVLMAGLAHKHPLLTTLTNTYHAIIIAKAYLL